MLLTLPDANDVCHSCPTKIALVIVIFSARQHIC